MEYSSWVQRKAWTFVGFWLGRSFDPFEKAYSKYLTLLICHLQISSPFKSSSYSHNFIANFSFQTQGKRYSFIQFSDMARPTIILMSIIGGTFLGLFTETLITDSDQFVGTFTEPFARPFVGPFLGPKKILLLGKQEKRLE